MAGVTAPDPSKWRIQQAGVMVRSDREVIALLKAAQADITAQLRELAARPTVGVGNQLRIAQLQLAKRNILGEQARLWRKIGDTVAARRLEGAARVIDLNQAMDTFLLFGKGRLTDGKALAQAIADAELDAARSGLDRMIARVNGSSYVPLSERVYRSEVNLQSKLSTQINSALARGLSAREFAASIRDFVNPNTPGGIRYAALRLSRTEINNAAHAVSVDAVRDKPWVSAMHWKLSGSHPRVDICNSYASGGPKGDGVYPKASVPAKPHPQCFCFVVPVMPDEDEFLESLLGGRYNEYLEKYRNIQPGQVIRSDFGGGTFTTPKSTPTKKVKAPAPRPPATPKPPPTPKKATAPKKAPVVKPKPVAAPRVTPTPGLSISEQAARQQADLFTNRMPAGVMQTDTRKVLYKMADQAPQSMQLLKNYEILDAAGTKRLQISTGKPNVLGGYYRFGQNRIEFVEDVGSYGVHANHLRSRGGWFSEVGPDFNGYQGIVAHEFGHHVDEMMQRLPAMDQADFWRETLADIGIPRTSIPQTGVIQRQTLDLLVSRNKYTIHQTVSEYGASSAAEVLAEVWAEYSTNPNARPHIKRIGERLKKLGEEGAQI